MKHGLSQDCCKRPSTLWTSPREPRLQVNYCGNIWSGILVGLGNPPI